MADSKSILVFEGEIGNLAKCGVSAITDSTALGTLKTFLGAHTDGKIATSAYSERTIYSGAVPAGGNTDKRLICYFQDEATGNTVKLSIPAPKSTDIEDVPGRSGGQRATDTFMGLLNTALGAATGKTFRSLYGYVVQKR